jgi:GDPmannose 4,6-dehydratase
MKVLIHLDQLTDYNIMHIAAIITGVTGQDGSYLAQLLLTKQYDVYGVARRTSRSNTERIAGILDHPRFFLREADLSDSSSLRTVFEEVAKYDRIEVYNLAAQSHVHTSFRQPELTADIDGLGPLRILEIIRSMDLRQARFYQASTSELYGKVQETPQSETTPFYPRSPYGVAKLYAFWIVKNYRESYGMFACNGILFNHESERRGEEFVTRKITKGIARLKRDPAFVLEVGNLDAKRDWGYAPDYVEGMWRMLQQDTPDDYVLATGETHTVREFIETAWGPVSWVGSGVDERGLDATGRTIVKINPDFYRPAEVDVLIGDPSKALRKLGWKATTTFPELVDRMVMNDCIANML